MLNSIFKVIRCSRPTIKFRNLPLFAPTFISQGNWRKCNCNSSLPIPRSTIHNGHFSRRGYLSAIRCTINVIATIRKSYVLNVLNPTISLPSSCLVFVSSLPGSLIASASPGHESSINLLRMKIVSLQRATF